MWFCPLLHFTFKILRFYIYFIPNTYLQNFHLLQNIHQAIDVILVELKYTPYANGFSSKFNRIFGNDFHDRLWARATAEKTHIIWESRKNKLSVALVAFSRDNVAFDDYFLAFECFHVVRKDRNIDFETQKFIKLLTVSDLGKCLQVLLPVSSSS